MAIGVKTARSFRLLIFAIGMAVVSIQMAGCAGTGQARGEDKKMAPKTIQQVLEEYTDRWMAIPGVVGTAIGQFEGRPCITVFVAEKTEQLAAAIPQAVGGYPVIIEETGEIRAL